LGVKKEDLPKVWADLNAAGMVSGHAYGKSLRTVKTCVGTDWCRFGTQDSTGLGVALEKFLWGSWTPAKVKMAVSGCPRNCSESTCKDVGVICVDSGYEIHFAGAAGLDIKPTEVLGHAKTQEEVIEIVAALIQLYREQGRYLERVYKWAKRVGSDSIRAAVLNDPIRRIPTRWRSRLEQCRHDRVPYRDRAHLRGILGCAVVMPTKPHANHEVIRVTDRPQVTAVIRRASLGGDTSGVRREPQPIVHTEDRRAGVVIRQHAVHQVGDLRRDDLFGCAAQGRRGDVYTLRIADRLNAVDRDALTAVCQRTIRLNHINQANFGRTERGR